MRARRRRFILGALALSALVLVGPAPRSERGDEYSVRVNGTEYPGATFGPPAPRTPLNRLRVEPWTRFLPGAAHNQSGSKNNIGDEIRRIVKHSRGQVGAGFGMIVYGSGPGDAIAIGSKVYGVAPTNAKGDEGVEGYRSEVSNAAVVPRLQVAEPDASQRREYRANEKGSHWIAVRGESNDIWRYMGEDALVVLTADPAVTHVKTRGFDRHGTKSWLPVSGHSFAVPRSPHPRWVFALEASRYPDLSGAESLDWLAVSELEAARLRTVWLRQGHERSVPRYYTAGGPAAHVVGRLEDPRAVLAPAYTLRDLRYAVDARNAPAGKTGLVELAEPLGAALAPGARLEVHSGGPPHAIMGSLSVVKAPRGGRAYGHVVAAKDGRHPLTAAFAFHGSPSDPAEGVAAEYGLDVDRTRHAVRQRYRGSENGAALSLWAMEGWGKRTYPVIAFERKGDKGQVAYDSARGEWLFDGETLDEMIDRRLEERGKR